MFLALREIRRAKVRFGLLVSAVALLVLLILGQHAIQNGLITSFVGGIEQEHLVGETRGDHQPGTAVVAPAGRGKEAGREDGPSRF